MEKFPKRMGSWKVLWPHYFIFWGIQTSSKCMVIVEGFRFNKWAWSLFGFGRPDSMTQQTSSRLHCWLKYPNFFNFRLPISVVKQFGLRTDTSQAHGPENHDYGSVFFWNPMGEKYHMGSEDSFYLSHQKSICVGGFKDFYLHPRGNDPIWRNIFFQIGLVQPPIRWNRFGQEMVAAIAPGLGYPVIPPGLRHRKVAMKTCSKIERSEKIG